MLTLVTDIQITVTRTEVEALLLEFQLIRELKPRYNILFRDDKSYPYIYLSSQHEFPQLTFYRGSARGDGDYFGPYPSTTAVRESIDLLQRTFKLRQCDDGYFKSRVRPCLQYQIKRCTAPCVGYIDKKAYAQDVRNVQLFLLGKTHEVLAQLADKMELAANKQNYEQAARIRDQIVALRAIQQQQIITDPSASQNIDILGVEHIGTNACVHVLSIRNGRMLGSRQYFPSSSLNMQFNKESILENFLLQYYANMPQGNLFPAEILIPVPLDNNDLVAEALKHHTHKQIKISHAVRGDRARWLQMAQVSATDALKARVEADAHVEQQILELSLIHI